MSPEILEYLLRVTVIWAVLLAYYGLALRRANFGLRRYYLLGVWAFGLVVPLLPSLGGAAELPVLDLPQISLTKVVAAEATREIATSNWQWTDFLPYAYLTGLFFFGARTLVQSLRLRKLVRTGEQSTYAGHTVVSHPEIPSPFAAGGRIFLPTTMPDAALTDTALLHETAHLRLRHHYDNFLLTIGSLLLWFHPLTWVLRHLLATVHEYQADAAVLQRVPARIYGRQLLYAAMGPTPFRGLFSSPLKKRITMISHNQEQRLRLFPLLGLCLLLLGLIVACSDAVEDIQPTVTEDIPGLELVMGDPADNVIPDEYPKPTGMEDKDPTWETLIRGIYQEVRYPQPARIAGQEGFVRLLVNISETGSVTNVTTVRLNPAEDASPKNNLVIVGYRESDTASPTVDPSLFATEVDRMINKLAPFTPAQLDGKPTAVQLEFDFQFTLE